MKTSIVVFATGCVLAFLGPIRGGQELGGTIAGTVLDQQNQPVVNMKVTASLLDKSLKVLAVKYVDTDQSGRFTIANLNWGVYKIFTRKEEDGYPNTQFSFYSDNKSPTAALSSASPTASVEIVLSGKAAVLRGSVTDSATGASVSAHIHLWRVSEPNLWMDKSLPQSYHVLIPSNISVGILVQAPGYADWYYPGVADKSQAGTVLLPPGNDINIDIRLQHKLQ